MKQVSNQIAIGVIGLFALFPVSSLSAEGAFALANSATPTRIDSTTGPLAGSNVFAIALVGESSNSLNPLGDPIPHIQGLGKILPTVVGVPFGNDGDSVYVEMAVWDASKWGLRYDKVPPAFIGYSDIVPITLYGTHSGSYYEPLFTRAAIVPQSVPEPSEVAMLVCGVGVIGWLTWKRRGVK